ncbi:MAG: RNA polymerase sigma factor [Gemmatimonadales bacterium]
MSRSRLVQSSDDMTWLELPISPSGDDSKLEELVALARAGSRTAFDALASRVRDRVRAWAAHLTRDQDDAEDVAQLVLLRLHKQLAEFEGRSRFTTWLYVVTRSVALSQRARERRRDALAAARANELAPATAAHEARATPETDVAARGVSELVASYLNVLSGREREVFELGDLRGMNATEIARRLDVKPVTVRTQLMRARRKIRLRMLEEHPDLLEGYRE